MLQAQERASSAAPRSKFRVQTLHNKFLTYERLWMRTLQEIENGTYKRDLFKAAPLQAQKKPESGERPRTWWSCRRRSPTWSRRSKRRRCRRPLDGPGAALRDVPAVARSVPSGRRSSPPCARGAHAGPGPAVPSHAARDARGASRWPAGARAPAVPSGQPAAPRRRPRRRPAAAARRTAARRGSARRGMSDDKLRAVYDAYVTAKRRCQEDTSKLSYDSVAATLRKQVPELLKQHNAKAVEFKVVIKDGKAVAPGRPEVERAR